MKYNAENFSDLIETMINENSKRPCENLNTDNIKNSQILIPSLTVNITNIYVIASRKKRRNFDTIAASMLMTLGVTLFILSPPASAQVRSPAKMQEAKTFMQSCDGYRGDDGDFCRLSQKEFAENWADANAGRLSSWRNLAYLFGDNGNSKDSMGVKFTPAAACAWRLSVLFTASDEVHATDTYRDDAACHQFGGNDFDKIRRVAQLTVRQIHLVAEENPQAPWNAPDPKAPRCPDTGNWKNDPPYVVHIVPPGCPKP